MEYDGYAIAVFGGGCFWCVEAVYERIDGVVSVISGYAGGKTENPGYYDVTSGKTGHAEVVKIIYDAKQVSYEELLELFWKAHNPTTLNRQGADVGTQYRSIILYTTDKEREIAEASIQEQATKFVDPIVTELEKLDVFYDAEEYHQDYYEKNPNAAYCALVIAPKLRKLNLE